MSLLKRILGSASEVASRIVPDGNWQTVEGNYPEDGVYVYDGRPLRGITKGQEFYAEVITRPTKLRSTLTGTTWNTKREGGIALAIGGHVFGSTRAYESSFRRLASMGGLVRVKMRRSGTYAKDIPTVEMLLPDSATMGLARDFGYLAPTGADVVILSLSDWDGSQVHDMTMHAPVGTRLVPTPAGSSAKPHVMVSVAGEDVDDVSARSSWYKHLARHVGEQPIDAFCQRKPSSNEPGAYYWRLVIVWGPQSK